MGLKVLKTIYDLSPLFLQNIFTTIYGYKLKSERYGKFYKNKIKELRDRNEKKFNYTINQMKQLNNFLIYSKKNCRYYSELLRNIELPLKHLDDIKRIPVLEKETIRNRIEDLITKPKETMIVSQTGGTTGKSLTVYYTKKDMQERMAYLDYFKELHGVKKGMRRASFTGKNLVPVRQKKEKFWRYNAALKQLLFSSFHATEENIPFYINQLNKFKPQSLDGFPSIMLKIAKYSLKNNIKFEFQPLAIFPTAETLLDKDKEILEKAFNCNVRNQYASSEGAPFITECKHGSLHLNIDTGVFEKVEESNISEIYVTSFTTHGTPLIRYKIGDSLEFGNSYCTCGIKSPIIKRILGRSMDFLYSEERGTISSANMSNTVKVLPNSVINVQFLQNEVDIININLVVDDNLYTEEHEKVIEKEMKYRFGKDVRIKFNYLDEIPLENSGKTRFIINNLSAENMKGQEI